LLLVGLALPSIALSRSNVVVSLQFDDGRADQYQAGAIMAKQHVHGTFFINSGRPGLPGFMPWKQIQALQAAGNEIGGHTIHHADLSAVPLSVAKTEICADRKRLVAHGFRAVDFAYPYGRSTPAVQAIVARCGYLSARDIGGFRASTTCLSCPFAQPLPPPGTGAFGSRYLLRTPPSIKIDTSLQTLEDTVIAAEAHGGGWVQFVMHHICAGPGCDSLSVSPATLMSLIKWLKNRGVPIQTSKQVLREG